MIVSSDVQACLHVAHTRFSYLWQMARSKKACIVFFDEVGSGGDNEEQRTMLEIVNQLDRFDARGNISWKSWWQRTGNCLFLWCFFKVHVALVYIEEGGTELCNSCVFARQRSVIDYTQSNWLGALIMYVTCSYLIRQIRRLYDQVGWIGRWNLDCQIHQDIWDSHADNELIARRSVWSSCSPLPQLHRFFHQVRFVSSKLTCSISV